MRLIQKIVQASFFPLVALLALAVLGGCGKGSTGGDNPSTGEGAPYAGISGPEAAQLPFRNLGSSSAFVGDDACFDCHESEYRGYKEHGMANSLFALSAETWTEELDGSSVFDSTLGYYYAIFEEDGKYFQEEYRLTDTGEKSHTQVREMQYVMGSGLSARSYFVWENGWFFQLPIAWYTQQRKWDMSPGYQISNKRFDRKVLPRCITCHDAFPTEVPFTGGKYEEIPLGISCERCHGPGGDHVAERLALPEADSVDYSIVNPAHLVLERRLDVCQQCHLNPDVSLLRQGRTPYDFRPSQTLQEYLAFFEIETPENSEEIGLTSHVGRMKKSACFTASLDLNNPLECTTCHDPHSGFREAGPEYFNATCRTCHESGTLQTELAASPGLSDHEVGSNCISCHMPKAGISKVVHSNFTDHWIRIVDEGEPGMAENAAVVAGEASTGPPGLIPIYESDAPGTIYDGLAYVVLGTRNRDSIYLTRGATILESVLSPESDFGEAHFLLGLAYTQLGEPEQSIPPLERAVTLDAGIPERLNALAQSYEAASRDSGSIERLYARALSIQPARSDIRLNYGRFLETRGRTEAAAEEYRKAILEEPWFAAAHFNLGTALYRMGRLEEAEAKFSEALQLDPMDPETWGNLGILFANSDRSNDALDAFEKAARIAPENPTALGNLGTNYLQRDVLPEAIRYLERAVAAAPDYVDGRVNLALAYFRNDQFEKARSNAEAVLRIAPENELARQILGAL